MIKYIIQFLFYSFLFLNVLVKAEDINSEQRPNLQMVMKCAKDNPVSSEDKEKLEKSQIPYSAKCLMACFFKSSGVMDYQGMLSVEGVHEFARICATEKPERPKHAKQYTDACLSVNDIEVSDGDKGCERAALMYKCGIEEAPEFDYIKEVMNTVHILN